jgi:hypothetical protein
VSKDGGQNIDVGIREMVTVDKELMKIGVRCRVSGVRDKGANAA